MFRKKLGAVVLVVAAFAATSCSSDDDSGAATPADPLDTTASAASATGAPADSGDATAVSGPSTSGTGQPAEGPATGSPYVVGASLELTGSLSELGEGFLAGAQLFFDSANERGGVAGRPVSLVALDHSNKPDQGVANTTRLITDDGAIAITGFVLSNACNASERVTTEAKVPLVCSAAEPDMLDPVRPFMFGSKYPTAYQAKAVVDFADSLVPSEGAKVAVVNLAAASSSAYGQRIIDNAKGKGWDVAVHEEVPPDVTDMSSQAAKVASSDADVVFTGLQDAPFILFMRTLQSQGVDVPVINYESGSSINALQGAASGNVYVGRSLAYPDVSKGPSISQFVEEAKGAGVDPNGPYVINGYVAAMIIFSGLQGCGESCTTATLQESLEQLDVDSGGLTAGRLSFTPEDHAPGGSVNVYRWNPGANKPELVAEDLSGDSK